MAWNPDTHPFRVVSEEVGSHLPYGWHDSVVTVTTEQEGIELVASRFPPSVVARRLERWDGKTFRLLASRKRGRNLNRKM